MEVACIILAAGMSSRMKDQNKLLLKVNGRSLIRRTVEEVLLSSVKHVIVVTGFESKRINEEVRSLPVQFIENPNYQSGMHSSIKAGVKALPSTCDFFFICLADQPEFDHHTIEILLRTIQENPGSKIVAPTFHGERGHPVLVSAKFIPEILSRPDVDSGCAYLFQHQSVVCLKEVGNASILKDIDEPADYESFPSQDPVVEFHQRTLELRKQGQPFAVATVVEVMGSASARTGSKALFDHKGINLLGWVGGGCAERFIGEEAVKCLQSAKTNIVLADLDDEVFGLGVACGGKMKVFIEPILPLESIPFDIPKKYTKEVKVLSGLYGWDIQSNPSDQQQTARSIEELLWKMSQAAAITRGRSGRSLRAVKPVPAKFDDQTLNQSLKKTKKATIIGRTRVTEALARHFSLLSYSVKAIGPGLKKEDYPSNVECRCLGESYQDISFAEDDIVIIASHTAQDPQLVKAALDAKAAHVAMIGSLKRSEEVLNYLNLKDQVVKAPLYIPAGLDFDAKNPEEIALSVVAEVIARKFDHES